MTVFFRPMVKLFFPLFIFSIFINPDPLQAKSVSDSLQSLLENTRNDSLRAQYLLQLGQLHITTDSLAAFRYFNEALRLKNSDNNDIQKIKVYWEAGRAYAFANHYKKALGCFHTATRLSRKAGDTLCLANSLYSAGLSLYMKGNYDSSATYLNSSLNYSRLIGNNELMCSAYNVLGVIYMLKTDYQKAMKAYIKANRLSHETGDKVEIANTTGNIAIIYGKMDRHKEAIAYSKKALTCYAGMGNIRKQGTLYYNLATLYDEIHQTDSALVCYMKALKLRKQIGDKKGISHTLESLGSFYNDAGKYPRALSHYKKSLALKKDIRDISGISTTFSSLASVYTKMGLYDSALFFLEESIQHARISDEPLVLMKTYNMYADLYANQHVYDSAYKYQRLYQQLKDSIYKAENNKNVLDLHLKYETRKKENKLKTLNNRIKIYEYHLSANKNKTFFWAGILSFLLILLFLYLSSYYLNRFTQSNQTIKKKLSFYTLNKQYPLLLPRKTDYILITLYAFLVLIILKPYKIDITEKYTGWYVALLTLVFLLFHIFNHFVLPKILASFFNPKEWTLRKETLFITWNIVSVSAFMALTPLITGKNGIDLNYYLSHVMFGFCFALPPVIIRIYNSYIHVTSVQNKV